uniref:U-box domain-containing protein 25 n=1 Tax=Erigeron canadensis TaxID=72917 RepID=UPI001CB900F9|nr:U-box domain-containing protein 25 [Erigeron canadensis]
MKSTNHPKLKPPPRSLFSCGFFRYCTQSVLSPTNASPPVLAPPPPPPPHSESSSSSTTSQSFTQWRFSHTPISTSNFETNPTPDTALTRHQSPPPPPRPQPPPVVISDLQELFHVAELQLSTGEELDRIKAIYMLQHSLVNPHAVVEKPRAVICNPRASVDNMGNAAGDLVDNANADVGGGAWVSCPSAVMRGVLGCLKDKELAKPATKVLLALCLGEGNRHVAVEEGAVGKVVDALVDLDGGAVAERALAALELLCTVAEGAAELRAHALVGPMMVEVMRRMETTRGRENAIGILAVIYGGAGGDAMEFAPPEEVARVVMLAMQGDCSARGRRKGAQLLKVLQENERLDLTQEVG